MRLAQIHIESRTEQPSNMRFMLKSHFENQEPAASLGLCHMSWFNPGSPTQQSTQATGLMVKQVRLLSWVMHVVWGWIVCARISSRQGKLKLSLEEILLGRHLGPRTGCIFILLGPRWPNSY